jgi:Cupin-like domain
MVKNDALRYSWCVEREASISYREFAATYMHPRRPVILTDATAGWPALSKWTPEFFRSVFGSKCIPISTREFSIPLTLSKFLAPGRTLPSTSFHPLYLRNVHIVEHFPELVPDFKISLFFKPNWLNRSPLSWFIPSYWRYWAELFIGDAGASFPAVHFDFAMTHAWIAQIYGKKQLWLVSPDQTDLIYVDPAHSNRSLVNSLGAPDLERFPKLAGVRVLTCILEPGEKIFIPAGWWHTAKCLDLSISLSGNFVNCSNFNDFKRHFTIPAFGRTKGKIPILVNRGLLWLHGVINRLWDFIDFRFLHNQGA